MEEEEGEGAGRKKKGGGEKGRKGGQEGEVETVAEKITYRNVF
jgi:hypothetical protein